MRPLDLFNATNTYEQYLAKREDDTAPLPRQAYEEFCERVKFALNARALQRARVRALERVRISLERGDNQVMVDGPPPPTRTPSTALGSSDARVLTPVAVRVVAGRRRAR